MSFDLKQIPGAVVEKTYPDKNIKKNFDDGFILGKNYGIDAQSSVRLKQNREKMARRIYQYWTLKELEAGRIKCPWDELHDAGKEAYLEQSDFIIANELEIIEVDKVNNV